MSDEEELESKKAIETAESIEAAISSYKDLSTYVDNRRLLNKQTNSLLDKIKSLPDCLQLRFGFSTLTSGLENKNTGEYKTRLLRPLSNPESAILDEYGNKDVNFFSHFTHIGVTNDDKIQFEGILDLAKLIFIVNKEKNIIDAKQELRGKYDNRAKQPFYDIKDSALEDLIACIFVLENTNPKYKNYFSYGKMDDVIIDDDSESQYSFSDAKKSFVIDIPYAGQYSVHFGSVNKYEMLLKRATDKIESILSEKLKYGQLSEEKYLEIMSQVSKKSILPDYTIKFYEHGGVIPLKKSSYQIPGLKKELKLPNKGILEEKDICDDVIGKIVLICNSGREAHGLGVKLGFPKRKIRRN